jgi:hypothetical protein
MDTSGANVLFAVTATYTIVTGWTLSDSYANQWTSLPFQYDGNQDRVQLWYSINPIVGPGHTITISGGGLSYPSLCAAGFSGSYVFDPSGHNGGNGLPSPGTGSVRTTAGQELLVSGAAFANLPAAPSGISSGFAIATRLTSSSPGAFGCGLAWSVQPVPVSLSPVWTGSPAATNGAAAVIAGFKPLNAVSFAPRRILN